MKNPWRCPKCGARIVRRNGKHGPFWACANWPACDIIRNNFGFSDLATRAARVEAHKAFDALWKTPDERRALYGALARAMRLLPYRAHISSFSQAQCRRVLELCVQWGGKKEGREDT